MPTPVPSQVGDVLSPTPHWCHPGAAAFWAQRSARLPPHGRPGALRPRRTPPLHAPNPHWSQRVKRGHSSQQIPRTHLPKQITGCRGERVQGPSLGRAGGAQGQEHPRSQVKHTPGHRTRCARDAPRGFSCSSEPTSPRGAAGWDVCVSAPGFTESMLQAPPAPLCRVGADVD